MDRVRSGRVESGRVKIVFFVNYGELGRVGWKILEIYVFFFWKIYPLTMIQKFQTIRTKQKNTNVEKFLLKLLLFLN